MRCVVVAGVGANASKPPLPMGRGGNQTASRQSLAATNALPIADFCNKIGTKRTDSDARFPAAVGAIATSLDKIGVHPCTIGAI